MKKALVTAVVTALFAVVAHAESAAPVWIDPATGMSFIRIEKGCYKMGVATPVKAFPDRFWEVVGHRNNVSEDEMPQHEACLNPFWMGMYEVQTGEWNKIMGDREGDDHLPVTKVTWDQAREFAKRLSERSGAHFRLPTEAEWEYACRAGNPVDTEALGRELVGLAWHSRGESRRHTPEKVGQLAANAFGLHDMLGNVWEWTEDSYMADGYGRHALYNPVVRDPAAQKVIRGASFRTEPRQTRCAVRGHISPSQELDSVGFRLVRVP